MKHGGNDILLAAGIGGTVTVANAISTVNMVLTTIGLLCSVIIGIYGVVRCVRNWQRCKNCPERQSK